MEAFDLTEEEREDLRAHAEAQRAALARREELSAAVSAAYRHYVVTLGELNRCDAITAKRRGLPTRTTWAYRAASAAFTRHRLATRALCEAQGALRKHDEDR